MTDENAGTAATKLEAMLLVLAEDVVVVPIDALSSDTQAALEGAAGDHVVTRELGRQSSHRVDREAAEFLMHFREPSTLLDAVLAHCEGREDTDPFDVLEGAYPLVARLRAAGFLTGAADAEREAIRATHVPGDLVHGTTIVECVHLLTDTEVYRAEDADGTAVALKLLRPGVDARTVAGLAREIAMLEYLSTLPVAIAPRLVRAGVESDPPFLISVWCESRNAAAVAARHRASGDEASRRALDDLVVATTDVFARLHEAGVVHGDVHPKNVLVAGDGSVTLVDFCVARLVDAPQAARSSRAGLPLFYEPELALALLGGTAVPHTSEAGEQYALATLLFLLLTGQHPISLSFERDTACRQLVETAPRSFEEVGASARPAVEAALARALAKDPPARHPSIRAFAETLQRALGENPGASEPASPHEQSPAGKAPAAPSIASSISGAFSTTVDALLARYGLDASITTGSSTSLADLLVAPTASVYYGAAGLAYALLRISTLRDDPATLAAADVWITRARGAIGTDGAFINPSLNLTPERIGPVALFHSSSGIHLVDALIRVHADDDMGARAAARRMLASISVERETDLEMSMGESSVLLGLAALHDALAPLKDGDLVTTVRAQGDVLRDRIWQALGPALDTSASGALRFLGLAHGWAGVFYATLRWSAATGAAPPEPLREHLSLLGKLAVNDGAGLGWPISRQTDAPAWPGWCHGSAGYALLWSLAASQFGDERFIELAEAAAEHSWAHRGGLSATLCCGLAGQGLAMLVLARQVDATRWRKRAHSLALAAMSSPLVARLSASEPTPSAHVEQEPLHSLFKGAVGPALLAAELEHDAIPDWPFCSAWR